MGGLILYLIFHYLGWGQIPLITRTCRNQRLGRRGAMGFSLRDLGGAWLCRVALAANASAHLHRGIAAADFRRSSSRCL